MYLPILRGKQFELIALRELNGFAENNNKISPIIEPVKKSFSTLVRTIISLKDAGINFTVIVNPLVGELIDKTENILEILETNLDGYTNFQLGIYSNSETDLETVLEKVGDVPFAFNGFSFIHVASIKEQSIFNKYEEINDNKFHIVNFAKTNRRYHRNFPKETRVSLDDFFVAQKKNSDYLAVQDEPFTEEHLYYLDDGLTGFSDYLTVGDTYSEGGFLPYAVAIHLTYPDDDNRIRIRHFVSDSNEDTSDIGGKFEEALAKLISWVDENDIQDTKGIREFRTLSENGHFPGLGVIKKLSIMHHIELVLTLI